jgi:hypothetical protein
MAAYKECWEHVATGHHAKAAAAAKQDYTELRRLTEPRQYSTSPTDTASAHHTKLENIHVGGKGSQFAPPLLSATQPLQKL